MEDDGRTVRIRMKQDHEISKIDEILFWITVKTFHQYWKSYQSSFPNLWNLKISEIKTIPVDSRLFSKKQGKISEICVI